MLVPTAVVVGPSCGRLLGENSTSPAARAPVAAPVAMPCTTRAIRRETTPSAVQKTAVLVAATRRAATQLVAQRSDRQQGAEQTHDIHREDHCQHRDRQAPTLPVQRIDR